MRSPEALSAALALRQNPQLVRDARSCPLPKGVTLLLEAAAGEAEALAFAAAATGRSDTSLRKAAGFFIEQVLLCREADSYRILGSEREASEAELRRHMALLMRWSHPDVIWDEPSSRGFNRGSYASRVTEAWEKVKTPERRAAYDASRQAEPPRPVTRSNGASSNSSRGPTQWTSEAPKRRMRKQLKIYGLRGEGFWDRLLLLFAGKR